MAERKNKTRAYTLDKTELDNFEILNGIPAGILEQIWQPDKIRQFDPGEYLLQRHQINTRILLLLEGTVEVRLSAGAALIRIDEGQSLGEISALDHQPASASVMAVTPCKVLAIAETLVWDLVEENHQFARNMLQVLTERLRYANNQTDISMLKANLDPLTSLHNRRWLDEIFEEALEQCELENKPFSFLMIDLDHFKNINDQYGHQAGDQVLKEIAAIIMQQARSSDTAIRYGGEEIALTLPGANRAQAIGAAERIRKRIEQYCIELENGQQITVTASIGVATRKDDQLPKEILGNADKALYAAKKAGRNRVIS